MIKVLYVGDYFIQKATWIKGVELVGLFSGMVDDGKFLREALQKQNNIKVTYMSGHQAFTDFPRTCEELMAFDVLILSDVSKDTLVLYPGFQSGPNRVKAVKHYVEQGGALVYCGGWLTFQGYHGNGTWYGTAVAEVLPVEILSVSDDRVELPEGEIPRIVDKGHPIFKGIPVDEFPPIYGYNRTIMKDDCQLLACIDGDSPFIAVGKFGKGQTLVYTSDPVPGWGMDFVKWKYYSKFWVQVVQWISSKTR